MKRWIVLAVFLFLPLRADAFWVWTPETNKWVNPKYAVKETPKEQLDYALQFYQAKDYKKAIDELNKLIKHYPRAREAAEAQYHIGLALQEQGELFAAFNHFQTVIEKYPFSERSGEIIKQQYEIGNAMLDGRHRENKFIKTVVGGDYNVIDVFRKVIKNAPYGEFAAPAQYKIGLYLQEKQLYQEARDEFEKTMNDYPDSEWAKAAKYQIALSDAKRSSQAGYDQKVTKVAIEEFKEFVQENPDAELSHAAKQQIHQLKEKEAQNHFLVAKFYERQKKFDAAKTYYTTIVEDYRDTSWAKKALEKIRELTKTK